jgi:phage baseplate assembly protein W
VSSIGVSLPIQKDSGDGFVMLKNLRQVVKQNLKMLVLTIPGERVMEPEFGVGLKTYLFSNFSEDIYPEIKLKIQRQAARYIPLVTITSVDIFLISPDTNSFAISIKYSIPDIGLKDLIEFTI